MTIGGASISISISTPVCPAAQGAQGSADPVDREAPAWGRAVARTDPGAVVGPVVAVVVAVIVMLLAADPLSRFIDNNPTVVMLALGFLLVIGTTLIAEGFGIHFPKQYIYAAMAFSVFIESLNMLAQRARKKANDLKSQ